MSMYDAATYSRTPEQIATLYAERRNERGLVLQQMQKIRDLINGDIVVPLPQLDKNEESFVANLAQGGLDGYASRIASYMPNLACPPTNARSDASVKRADTRKRATLSWWESSLMQRQLRRRARFLLAYSNAPAAIRPDFKAEVPRWEARNPLTAFAAPPMHRDDLCPTDAIYAAEWSYGRLRRQYPYEARLIAAEGEPDSCRYTVLEYDDAEQITTILLGGPDNAHYGRPELMVLESVPNRAGIPLTVVPSRITLDRDMGQFDGLVGMHIMRAKLTALEVIAATKNVFPTMYLESRPNETARFISGPHEGTSGLVNEVEGGVYKELGTPSNFNTLQTIDRLERSERLSGGIPAEMGGESATNIRTGRRGEQVMSSVVDFPVQEAQETLAAALEEENRRATKVAKAYFGGRSKSFHVQWKGAQGHVTYTPNKDFDSDYTQVKYAATGSDINNLVIGIGQRVGIGTMSKKTAMALDPMVADAELEHDLVLTEGIEAALLQGFQTKVADGEIPPADAARVMQLVKKHDMNFEDAILKAQEEAQERQASVTAEGAPDAVDPLAPAAQPGLAAPGMGAEAGAAIAEPPSDLGRLDQLLSSMRSAGAGA